MQRVLFLLAAITWCAPGATQEIRLLGDFNEITHERSRVSGHIIVGLMLADDVVGGGTPDVWTGVPPRWTDASEDTQVCVRLTARDGLYEGTNTYLVEAGFAGEFAQFAYMGDEADFLAERPVAVRVSEGPCGGRVGPLVPAALGARPPDGGDVLYAYINTAGSPAALVVGASTETFECEDIGDSTARKYTASCAVPRDRLGEEETDLTFLVSRSRTEEHFTLSVMPVFGNE